MGESQLDRIRGDLEAMRAAAGFSLPFGWEDVWFQMALVPCGVILAFMGTFAPLNYVKLGFMVLMGMTIFGAIGLRVWFRRSTGRSPVRRREYTLALAAAAIVGLLAGYHLIWGQAHGLSPMVMGGVLISCTGGGLALLALTGRGRRAALGAAVPALVFGFVFHLLTHRQVFVGAAILVVLTALLTSLIEAVQLRSDGGGHEPAAD
jgi:hypothetical protein